jgi:hypothetical protein
MGAQEPKERWPSWLEDLVRSLSTRSQFVLWGNIRDTDLVPVDGEFVALPIISCLWEGLRAHGYQYVLVYDRVDGLTVFPQEDDEVKDELTAWLGGEGKQGPRVMHFKDLPPVMHDVALAKGVAHERRIAMVVDYASRLLLGAENMSERELEFFAACEKLSHTARPVPSHDVTKTALFNPIIWLADRENDLPDWFVSRNPWIRSRAIALPDYDARRVAVQQLVTELPDYDLEPTEQRQKLMETFTDHTDGLPLSGLDSITRLAMIEKMNFSEIGDAVRLYKLGVTENPWKEAEALRQKIAEAEVRIGQRVKGQDEAVGKTVDILKRSVTGLTGAHASRKSGRPKGVLFFAGPTGVGKTELAKAITQLIFGDEQAYIRFDMSEFSAEHSDARLLGAPPGYVGFGAGGELTEAVRQKPFCVILFDEIEKAHPRILDKFLQVLEDGRITDGRGTTTYFSEALIIFTSNLGIYVDREFEGRIVRELNVRPNTPYPQVKERVRSAIEDHFKVRLNRPELLNRIGDNIVVFDFIRPDAAKDILQGMLENVAIRTREERGYVLEIAPEVLKCLEAECASDLSNGGRGIGNRLESQFVNPLAHVLFERGVGGGERLLVTALTMNLSTGNHALSVELRPPA